jgi:hypothetical protein
MRLKIKTIPVFIKGSEDEDRYAPTKRIDANIPNQPPDVDPNTIPGN